MQSAIILLSIHPEYAEKIFSGDKTIEFRKQNIPLVTRMVVVYSTAPISKIVGIFTVKSVIEATPTTLWNKFKSVGGIDRDPFFNYYKNKKNARGLVVESTFRVNPNARQFFKRIKPPQSFAYLDEKIAMKIIDSCLGAKSLGKIMRGFL